MRQVLQDQPLTVFGDGLQTRAFSHIDDVAPLIAEVADRTGCWNEVFNIGADQPYTVLEIARQIGRALDVQPRIRHLAARNEVTHAYADHSKLRRFFGERPLVPLDEGIRRMADDVKRRGVPEPTPAPPIEIPRNLPEGWEALRENQHKESS
jgi:UDP-glucose 4-epimerase